MADSRAVVAVDVRPSPIAAWFHRLLTSPVIELDGRAHAARWGTATIPVSPGEHRLTVYFRYRGQKRARLAAAEKDFAVDEASSAVDIAVRLGPRNGSRFRIGEPVARR
ncbi:hypothetical protein [Streptomyces varsoviensis]|uniref:hypothetical protein n=1 Tax=Streptomyces varsoviensis TaxID=67373 RepID=UPI0012FE8201|nr:hypothetical protein [Streptomyces varsoviensis]